MPDITDNMQTTATKAPRVVTKNRHRRFCIALAITWSSWPRRGVYGIGGPPRGIIFTA